MYSQSHSDCDEAHCLRGARFFKASVTLSAGAGLLVGAIVALFIFPRALHEKSLATSDRIAAFPTFLYSRGAERSRLIPVTFRQPFLRVRGSAITPAAMQVARDANYQYGEADGLTTRPYQYADKQHDPFYGLGGKQVQQSKQYGSSASQAADAAMEVARASHRSRHIYGEADGLTTRPYQYADKQHDPFYGLGGKQVQQSKQYGSSASQAADAAMEVARASHGSHHIYGEADGLTTRPYQYADKQHDPFYGLGGKQAQQSKQYGSSASQAADAAMEVARASHGSHHQYGESNGLTTRPYQYADKQNDPFYGIGSKQAQHSGKKYAETKGKNLKEAYGLRSKHVQESKTPVARQ